MRIETVENTSDGINISGHLIQEEFRQLAGELDPLSIFSPQTLSIPTAYTKTGARKSYAKWLLLPKPLRNDYKAKEYNFDNMMCGKLESLENLFIIYKIPKRLETFMEES